MTSESLDLHGMLYGNKYKSGVVYNYNIIAQYTIIHKLIYVIRTPVVLTTIYYYKISWVSIWEDIRTILIPKGLDSVVNFVEITIIAFS